MLIEQQKCFPRIAFDFRWQAFLCNCFHHPVLPELSAQTIYMHEECCSARDNDADANERIDATDIKNSEEDKQHQEAPSEIPYILCLQAFKFYWLIDALINLVYTAHYPLRCLL